MMKTTLLDSKQVAEMCRICQMTIWNRLRKGTFPKPITAKGEKRLWNAHDIEAYLAGAANADIEEIAPVSAGIQKWHEAYDEARCAKWGI